jgi:peptidoglycan-N-acetylglucosamine deacetylase
MIRRTTFAITRLIALAAASLSVPAAEIHLDSAVQPADCPGNPNAIGTSRTIVVNPTEHPLVGGMQYRESLPLQDHEVVLTFDDGPLPPFSNRVLEILASECVKANYFLVGGMALSFPDVVRRIYEAGHTIGTHSQSHPLRKMPLQRAEREINDGIASVKSTLGDGIAPAPFFRFPGLLRSEAAESYLASQHLMTWSIDFPADDWMKISPAQVYARALARIEAHGKGILLLHDIHERTVEALPYLLRELKQRGYHIVHVVAATPDLPKTATDPRQWIIQAGQISPQVLVYPEAESKPELLGAESPKPADPNSLVRHPAPRPHTVLSRSRVPLTPVPIWPRSRDTATAASPVNRSRGTNNPYSRCNFWVFAVSCTQ